MKEIYLPLKVDKLEKNDKSLKKIDVQNLKFLNLQ